MIELWKRILIYVPSYEGIFRKCNMRICKGNVVLKDRSGVGMINTTKQIYQLLIQILTVISYLELPTLTL